MEKRCGADIRRRFYGMRKSVRLGVIIKKRRNNLKINDKSVNCVIFLLFYLYSVNSDFNQV